MVIYFKAISDSLDKDEFKQLTGFIPSTEIAIYTIC